MRCVKKTSVSVVNLTTIILLQVVVEERVLLSTQPVVHGIVRRLFVIKLYKPVVHTMIIVALARRYILKVHILGAIVFRILVLKVVEHVAWLVVVKMDVAVPVSVDEDILVVVEAAHTAILWKATILTLLTANLCLFHMLVC